MVTFDFRVAEQAAARSNAPAFRRGRASTLGLVVIVLGVAGYFGWQLLYEFGVLGPARFRGNNLFISSQTEEEISTGGPGEKPPVPRPPVTRDLPDALDARDSPTVPPGAPDHAGEPLPSGRVPARGVAGIIRADLESLAAISCLDALRRGDGNASGLYTVDPDGRGPDAARLVYCDMETDGGGWTLCLNSLRERPAPDTRMTLEIGCAGWRRGHVRDCRYLYRGRDVEVRHLLVAGNLVVNRAYAGRPQAPMPPSSLWRRFGPSTARDGEADDGATFGWTLATLFGAPWRVQAGQGGGVHRFPWYTTPTWGVLPISRPGDSCGGGPVVRKGPRTWCADRYAIFLRETAGSSAFPGDAPGRPSPSR